MDQNVKNTSSTVWMHSTVAHNYRGCVGPNCPGFFGTVTDFFAPSGIPDSFIIVPEVEERRTIKTLVTQVLNASLAVYGGIIRSATRPKRYCG